LVVVVEGTLERYSLSISTETNLLVAAPFVLGLIVILVGC